MSDRRDEEHDGREKEDAERRHEEERDRRSDELREAWRRNHPSTPEEVGRPRRPRGRP